MTINHELLSALVDGEIQGEELDQALQILATDKDAVAQFQNYQQSTDILKGYGERGLSVDFSNKMSAILDDEPVYSQPTMEYKAEVIELPKPFWKQVTGLAIAASVGALAVVGVMKQPENNLAPMIPVPMAVVKTTNEAIKVAQTGVRWTVDETEVANRLDNYLLDHNEHTGSSGVFSYARVVSYGAE